MNSSTNSLNYSSRLRAWLHANIKPSADGRHDGFGPRTLEKQKGCSRKRMGFGSVADIATHAAHVCLGHVWTVRVGKSFLHVCSISRCSIVGPHSTHFRGAHAPVEEPSAASVAG